MPWRNPLRRKPRATQGHSAPSKRFSKFSKLTPSQRRRREIIKKRWKVGGIAGAAVLAGTLGFLGLRPKPRPPIEPVGPRVTQNGEKPINGGQKPIEIIDGKPIRIPIPENNHTTPTVRRPRITPREKQVMDRFQSDIRTKSISELDYPFINPTYALEAIRQKLGGRFPDFKNPSWTIGSSTSLENALKETNNSSVLELRRINPETNRFERTFIMRADAKNHYLYIYMTPGGVRGLGGNFLDQLVSNTGSYIHAIYNGKD